MFREVVIERLQSFEVIEMIVRQQPASNGYLSWRKQQSLLVILIEFEFDPSIFDGYTLLPIADLIGSEPHTVQAVCRQRMVNVTKFQLRTIQNKFLRDLQNALSQITILDRCDIWLFHVVLCLAAESILHSDYQKLALHLEMARNILNGILQHWGVGGHNVFANAINSLQVLDNIMERRIPPSNWLYRLFQHHKYVNEPGLPAAIHSCLQYGCEITHNI